MARTIRRARENHRQTPPAAGKYCRLGGSTERGSMPRATPTALAIPEQCRDLEQGVDARIGLGGLRSRGVQVPPGPAPDEDREHAGGLRRAHIVVEPVADV